MRHCHSSMAAPKRTLVIIAFAALYVIWGSTYLGIRFAIETIPPFLMAGARFVLAGVIMYAVDRIGTLLREHGVNIATMSLSRNQAGGTALTVLNLDTTPSDE